MVENSKAENENFSENNPKFKMKRKKIILGLLTLAIIVGLVTTIVVNVRKTVTLNVDGKEESIVTYKSTVEEVLVSKGIELKEKDKVRPSRESKVNENEKIIVKKAVPVNVKMGDKAVAINTAEDTVGQALVENIEELKSLGIDYNKDLDEVNPGVEKQIKPNMNVKVVDVEIRTVKEDKSIPYETVVKKDSNLEKGKKVVKNEGANGKKQVTYEIIVKDGKEVSKKEIQSKTLSAPVSALVVQGTKNPIKYIPNRSGSPMPYKKKLVVQSTAYSITGTTATGYPTVYNPGGISTIAVDPRVIPLGSLVYVDGYGLARASDTGGAIKGNIIDVYFTSHSRCIQWGRKSGINAYIIAYPGQW